MKVESKSYNSSCSIQCKLDFYGASLKCKCLKRRCGREKLQRLTNKRLSYIQNISRSCKKGHMVLRGWVRRELWR